MIRYIYPYLLLIFSCSSGLTAQINGDDTIRIYQSVVGEYEYYSDLQYYYFKLYLENKSLVFEVLNSGKIHKVTPVVLADLKFKISDSVSEQYLNFQKNINNEISICRLITGGSECLANRQTARSDPDVIAGRVFPAEALRADLIQIKDILINVHPAVYRFTSKELFEKIFKEQFSKIDKPMNLREFYLIATPLVESVHCGHTVLILPDNFWNNKGRTFFPMRLAFIGGRAYVQSFYNNENIIPAGSEILSVNEIPMTEIIASTTALFSADGYNKTLKLERLELRFQDIFNIRYGNSDNFEIEYVKPGSKLTESKKINAGERCFIREHSDLDSARTSTGDPNLDFKIDASRNLALMKIESFLYMQERDKFYSYIDEAFEKININNIQNLILDLRDNYGGDGYCASRLFSYLESDPVPYITSTHGFDSLDQPVQPAAKNRFSGKVYVLINGGCFSATGMLCALLKFHKRASFIGVQTGSTYLSNSLVTKYNPRETRLTLIVARMAFSAAVTGISGENGIMPDYYVEPGIEDLMKGKDTVKEFAFRLIENHENHFK